MHKRSQQHEEGGQATQENRLIYEALHFPLVQIVTDGGRQKGARLPSSSSLTALIAIKRTALRGYHYVHVQLFDKPRTLFMSANLIVSIGQRRGVKMTNAAIVV